MDTHELYDQRLQELLLETTKFPVDSEEFATASKNLRLFSESRTLMPEPEPTPDPVPTTVWEKVKAGASTVWESETTRVFIKAGGAFGGVGLVVWSTIHRDHVIDRQAMTQANQHPQ